MYILYFSMKHSLKNAEVFSSEPNPDKTQGRVQEKKGTKDRFRRLKQKLETITVDRVETQLRKERVRQNIDTLIPMSFAEFQEAAREQPTDALDAHIERITNSFTTRNEAELFSTGPEAFAEIEDQIDKATSSISIRIFSWASDSTGMRLAQKIAEAKEKNPDLKITVHIDKMGCFFNGTREGIQKNILAYVKKHALKYLFKYPLIRTRKIVNFAMDANAAYDFTSAEKNNWSRL